jgi:EAL domain-containing protein (putative c-di-GMP-specific phosphodiesterase class I)/sensor domain CHASE-containing protein
MEIRAVTERGAGQRKSVAIGRAAEGLPNVPPIAGTQTRWLASRIVSVAGLVAMGFLMALPSPALETTLGPVETVPAERALQALRRAWLEEIEELTAINRALAVADDTYEFVARPNLPYVYDHYDRKRLAADRIDTVLIVNRKGKPLFWRRVSNGSNRGFPDAEAFLAELPALTSLGATGVRSLAGAARLARGPALVVALPIYPADGSGEARGWLITARALDDAEQQVFERKAHVAADVLDPDASALPAGSEAALKTPLEPVTRVDGAHIRGFMSVPDLAGRPFRVFSVALPRPVAAAQSPSVSSIRQGLWFALAAIIAAIVCIAGARSVLLRRRDRAAIRAAVNASPAAAVAAASTGLAAATARAAAVSVSRRVTVSATSEPSDKEKREFEVTLDYRPGAPALVPDFIAARPAAAAAPASNGLSTADACAAATAGPVTVNATPETSDREVPELDVTFDYRTNEQAAVPDFIAAIRTAATAPAPKGLPTAEACAAVATPPGTVSATAKPSDRDESELELRFDSHPSEPAAVPYDIAATPAATTVAAPNDFPTAEASAVAAVAPVAVSATAAPSDKDEPEIESAFNSRPSEPAAVPVDTAESPAAAAAVPAAVGLVVVKARAPETARHAAAVAPVNTDRRQESEVEVTFDFRPCEPPAALGAIAEGPAEARDQLLARLTQRGAVIRYQPQINLRTGRIAGVEALLCVPESAAYRPAPGVVAELEAAGLGYPLLEWRLQEACSARNYWRRQIGDDFPVSIPVSTVMLEDPAIPALVRKILADNELSSRYLELEVPEAAIGEGASALRTLAAVREGGLLVAIDGYDGSQSNFRSLTIMQIAKFRVDPSLVLHAGAGAPDEVLFGGIVGAARGLGIVVCATGVDSPDLAAAAERHGCTLAQGASLGPLVDGEQFLTLVRGSDVDTVTLPPLQLDRDPPKSVGSSSWPRVTSGRRT